MYVIQFIYTYRDWDLYRADKSKMSLQVRKKSSSLAHYSGATHNKAAHCDTKYDNKLCYSKSVHAFRQTVSSSKHKNHNHNNNRPQRQLLQHTTTSMQRYVNNKKCYDNNGSKSNINNSYNNNSSNNKSVVLTTGQCYKQAIDKRKKKSLSISSQNNIYKNKLFSQQLLVTIDTFQQTLCSLPLDKLILSQNPFYWVQQQVHTLQNLREKFFSVQKLLREDTRGYYISKLQNVTRMLINIKDNLQTLTKMTVLKNYNSGGLSINSRNSLSEKSLETGRGNGNDVGNCRNINAVEMSGLTSKLVGSPHFSIESVRGDDKENEMNAANGTRGDFSKVKMVKSQLKGKQISQHDQLILRDYNQRPSDSTSKMSSEVRMIVNDCRTQKSLMSVSSNLGDNNTNSNSNSNNSSRDRQSCIMIGMRSDRLQSQQRPQFSMNKTVSKYHHLTRTNDNKELLGNQRDGYQQESKQTFNTLQNYDCTLHSESVNTLGQSTKRLCCHPISNSQHTFSIQTIQQLKKLRQQLNIKNDILLKLQQKHMKQLKSLQVQFGRKEKHYLETIYELKTENQQKELSIKQLLIEKQEQSEQLQLALRHLKSSIQSKKEHSGKQSLLKDSLETLTSEINKSKVREDELRETVQLERQRTKKVLKDMQELEQQLQTLSNQVRQKQLQLQQSKVQHLFLQKKLNQLILESQKFKSKQDIYKIKYFKLYADFDQFKQKVNDSQHYWSMICLNCKKDFIKADKLGDSQKGIELRELINFHKRALVEQQQLL